MAKEERVLSAKEVEKIRDSVERGVDRVVKPFLKRVEAQSKVRVRGNMRIR